MNDLSIAKMYVNKAQSAKDRGLDFTISFLEYKRLLLRKRCAYTGERFSNVYDDKWRSRSLERIDNKYGYISGNVTVVCHGINQFKSVIENPTNPLTMKMILKMIRSIDREH